VRIEPLCPESLVHLVLVLLRRAAVGPTAGKHGANNLLYSQQQSRHQKHKHRKNKTLKIKQARPFSPNLQTLKRIAPHWCKYILGCTAYERDGITLTPTSNSRIQPSHCCKRNINHVGTPFAFILAWTWIKEDPDSPLMASSSRCHCVIGESGQHDSTRNTELGKGA
jgi:hypothetical protein